MESLRRAVKEKLNKLQQIGPGDRRAEWYEREENNLNDLKENLKKIHKDAASTEAEWEAVHKDLLKCKTVLTDIKEEDKKLEKITDKPTPTLKIPEKETKMGPIEFLKFASSMIKSFAGDQVQLESFIVNVNLVKSVCTPELLPFFENFVNGRLEGKARNYIPETSPSVDDIIECLKKHIKPESSAVLEAKLTSVNLDIKNLTQFTEEVERISDKLIQALVSEGVTSRKATEMSVTKVVETCRSHVRDDLVKCVMASAQFDTPKAVLAKFTTEVAARTKERQAMANGKRGHEDQRRGQSRQDQYREQNRVQFRDHFDDNDNVTTLGGILTAIIVIRREEENISD